MSRKQYETAVENVRAQTEPEAAFKEYVKAEYEKAVKKAGAHSIVIMMSAGYFREVAMRDLWLRAGIGLLTAAAAGLFGFAWRNFGKTHDLQLRLVKASEMNTHLKEMNLAAAGLAHETRNPLNIIRGLAQMISKQTQAPAEVREKSTAILEETDRVTAQLNEFINYSRPREVRRSPVAVGHVIADVARALAYDAEEKKIQLTVPTDELVIEADEQLLRQALFNLLLNAVQAAEPGGEIQVVLHRFDGTGASIDVCDNGPGVAPDQRAEIFKPYVTTHRKGTGLGLAVVQQIVSAHGWDIECLDNQPRGAIFRISRVKTLSKA
jgi:signal transduction histidine kinase